MGDFQPEKRVPREGIDGISTRWPMIHDPVKFAMRYGPAIQGYLGVFLKNPHDVEDVCQAFLLRIIERGLVDEGDLHGRFRDYLIAAVRNAALAHLRRRSVPGATPEMLAGIAASEDSSLPDDEEWLSRWRRVVLTAVWETLENHERDNPGNLAHTVLRALVDHPDESSTQLAARVSATIGRRIAPEAFRKQVSRARRLFAELLVAETERTLNDPTPDRVEQELIDIGVMKYVQPFLSPNRRAGGQLLDGG